MSLEQNPKELRDFERRPGENSETSSIRGESNLYEDDYFDDQWEKYSDYGSDEEGKTSHKTGGSGNIGENQVVRQRRVKANPPQGRYGKKENVEGSDKYGTYEKYEKYAKHDKYEKYDKFVTNDKYDKFGKYDKYSKQDNYDNYHIGNYDTSYNKGYQKGGYKDYNYYKDFNKTGYNENRKYSGTYRDTANYHTPLNDNRAYGSSKKYDKFSDQKYRDQKFSDHIYSERKYSTDKHDSSNLTSLNSSYRKDQKDSLRKTEFKDLIDPSLGGVSIEKVFNTNTNYSKKAQVQNTPTFERGKNVNFDKSNFLSSNGFNDDREYYKKDEKRRFYKDNKREFQALGQVKDINEKKVHNTFEDLKKPVFINSSKIQKDIEGSNKKVEISEPKETEHKKGIPITNMLNVPMNKIDETIHNSKEKYILQQMSHVNLSSSSKVDEKEANQVNLSISNNSQNSNSNLGFVESFSQKGKTVGTLSNTQSSNLNINSQQNQQTSSYQYPQPQSGYPQNPNPYYNMQRPGPIIYNPYMTNPQSFQQQGNFKYTNNIPVIQHAVNPQVNTINAQINSQINQINPSITPKIISSAQPLYNNSQLTNYYTSSLPINYMFPNYNQSNIQMGQLQPEPAELDVKEFSDKLNLNAKVYVPKNKPQTLENKFDMGYQQEGYDENFMTNPNLQAPYPYSYNYYKY